MVHFSKVLLIMPKDVLGVETAVSTSQVYKSLELFLSCVGGVRWLFLAW